MKKSLILFSLVLLCVFGVNAKTVSNLHLFVERSIEDSTGEKVVLKGVMYYDAFPYSFLFEIREPENQIVYADGNDCFFIDNKSNTVIDFSDGKSFVDQTANDTLNWFKADFGLSETDYKIVVSVPSGNETFSVWKYEGQNSNPIKNVHTYSDTNGKITRLKMYLENKELFADTKVMDYEFKNGFSYPRTIETKSYKDNKFIQTTILSFSNVQFAFNSKIIEKYKTFSKPQFVERFSEITKNNEKSNISNLDSSNTSITGIIFSGGFWIYKKLITSQDLTNCSFYPTCSQYMLEAVKKNGVFGIFQGIERLNRCTSVEHRRNLYPLTKTGAQYDPVP